MSTKQKRFILPEDEIPKYWYNIQADMKTKPMPPLNPKTKEALKPEDLYPIFAKELCKQELNQTDAWIEIPEAVREMYKYYRSTPLVRAYGLEKALGTPAHIYFKNESVSPIGSHKLNSALAQAYYCKEEGVTNVTTETGAGQWGAALSYAAKVFGLEAAVYQVKISYNQNRNPNYQGSLGTAISEAIELAMSTPNCKYTLGSVLSHVTLHQTVIGLEAEKQMEMAGEYPDMIIVIVSQLLKDNLMEAVDIQQLESFQAGCLFAQAEGIIPAPESCHAIAAAIREAAAVREANKCKESGEEKVILFNLSGHGLIDMASYDQYLAGNLMNYELKDEDIQKNLDEIKDM